LYAEGGVFPCTSYLKYFDSKSKYYKVIDVPSGHTGRFPGTTNGGGFESAELALFFQLTPDASRPCYSVGVEVISLAR